MAGAIPGVRGFSTQQLYPFTRTVSFLTRVQRFANATEQRWMVRPPLTKFSLSYAKLLAADKNSQNSFFNSQFGQFDDSITITDSVAGITYSNMRLLSDAFTVQQRQALAFDTGFELAQTQNGSFSWTAPSSPVFPALSNGAKAMYPFKSTKSFLTVASDLETGAHYAQKFFGAGFSGFPTGALGEWELQFSGVKEADAATFEAFFRSVAGRLSTFQFTDPLDNTVHTKCRFGMDDLAIRYNDFSNLSFTLSIVETN